MASVKNTSSEIFPVISRNRNNILNSETQIVNNVYSKIRQVKVQNIRATLITPCVDGKCAEDSMFTRKFLD